MNSLAWSDGMELETCCTRCEYASYYSTDDVTVGHGMVLKHFEDKCRFFGDGDITFFF
jgi:hypothetical protein